MFTIDPRSGTPPYEQLRAAIVRAVGRGQLGPGTRLPTVRKLADDLGLAPNTVARSYRALERDKVIETRGRHGSFIATFGGAAERQAQSAAAAYAERVRELGIEPAEAVRLVEVALNPAEP